MEDREGDNQVGPFIDRQGSHGEKPHLVTGVSLSPTPSHRSMSLMLAARKHSELQVSI